MSDDTSASAVSRSAAGGGGRGHGTSEPKTKKQRLVADAGDQNETDEVLHQKAVSLVFGGELYAKFLKYAGPEGITYLRDDRRWRKAMDELSADEKKVLNLPSVPRPRDLDLRMVRALLTEPNVSPHTGRRSGWIFNKLGYKVLAASPLTSTKTLDQLIQKDSNDEMLRDILDRRFGVPVKILKKVLCAPEAINLLDSISYNRNLTAEISASLLYLSVTNSIPYKVSTICHIAKHRNTGELELSFLSRHDKVAVRRAVAENEAAGRYDLLHSLSMDDKASVRAAVARNKDTSLDDLITLSVDCETSVRASVAKNQNAGVDLLSTLIMDSEQAVLRAVANSKEVVVDTMFNAADKNHRLVLAQHSKSPETLTSLVGMDDGSLDALIAANPCTPPALLERLSDSDDLDVLVNVASNHNAPESVFQKLAEVDDCRGDLAINPSTAIQTLEILANDEDWAVRENVARNESTTPAILQSMLSANEEEDDVLRALYENRKCSLEMIVEKIRIDLNRAGNLTDALVESLWSARCDEGENLPADVVVAMSKDDNEYCRNNALALSQLPVSDIVRVYRDPLCDIDEASSFLRHNPVVQVAVEKISHLLSSSGVGSDSHFEKGEHWW